jgi:hypothetical protein
VFAPEHTGPVYEMELPFYDPDLQEPFWIGFCLRGGQGFNKNGLSSADPNSLFATRPSVTKNCILDAEKIATVSLEAPKNPDVKVGNEFADLTWEEPTVKEGDDPVIKYRLFLSEKDSTGLP